MRKKKKNDIWTIASILVFLVYISFMVYPLFGIIRESIFDETTGLFTLTYFQKFFSKSYYLGAITNSFKVTICVTIATILIATPLAYIMSMIKIKGASFIRIMILISSMSAPFVGAYSWILLLGRNGTITRLFNDFLHIPFPNIYGFGGICLVITLQLVPLVFMYVSGALRNMDNSLMEAAEQMGCTGIERIIHIVIPLIMPTLLASMILVFMSAFSDWGTPMLIGEGFKTVPVIVYNAFMGETGTSNGFASAISVIVICFTTVSFLLQKAVAKRWSFRISSLNPIEQKELSGFKNIIAHAFIYLYAFIALLPQMSVLENSFRKTKGVVLQTGYSFTSYEKAINKLSNVFINTGKLSLIAIMIIVILGIVIAYVTVRRSNPLNYMIDIMSMIPYVIPGSIIGIGLVIAFNNKPLILTGTAVIMIIDYVIRELPYTVRSSSAILNNIDISIEEAALSLGSGNLETFFTVTLPIMSPGVISGAIYSWISIITELSGSIMLYTVGTKTLTIEIYSQVVRGNNGVAAALATILSAITALATMIIFKLTGKDEIAI